MAKKQSKTKKGSKKRVSRRNKIQKGGNQRLIDVISDENKTREVITEEVQGLLNDKSIELEKRNDRGRTPLYTASARGFAKVVRLLVDAGANVNTEHMYGNDLLHTVSYFGHKDVLEVLLSVDGINVNAKERDGSTPLHYAVTYGRLGAVEALLEHPMIDVNGDGKDTLAHVAEKRLAPLHEALYHNNGDIAKALINHPKIDLESKGIVNSTPLGLASQKGKLDIVKALLEKGAKVDNLSARETPLYIASANGHADVVRVLLEWGANHNIATSLDETPLYIASANGHADVVRVLLDAAQSKDYVNKPDNMGKTPLHIASENGHTDLVSELVCAGAQVNLATKVDITPLFLASYFGHIDVVKKLLSHPDIRVSSGIGPDGKATKRADGKTAVSVAAANKHFDIVELLMPKFLLERPDYGRIQAQKERVEEQWQKAVERRGVAEVVVKGRSHQPYTVSTEDESGKTKEELVEGKQLPLGLGCRRRADGTLMLGHIAEYIGGKRKTKKSKAKKGSKKRVSRRNKIQKGGENEEDKMLDKVSEMFEQGKDRNKPDKNGKTALHRSAQKGYLKVVQELLFPPAVDVNNIDHKGRTALHHASQKGHLEVVKALLADPNINVNIQDEFGKTPLHHAYEIGDGDVEEELLAAPGINEDVVDINGNKPKYYGIIDTDEVVKWMLREGDAINAPPHNNDKALVHSHPRRFRLTRPDSRK